MVIKMKSVGISWILLIVILVFTVLNSVYVTKEVGAIKDLTEKISDSPLVLDERKEENKKISAALAKNWDDLFPYLTFVCSYSELNRADEAMTELLMTLRTETYEDTVTARGKLLDALRRILELEGFSIRAIF